MPRGAEYAGEPPHSDNAVPENAHNIVHGVGGTTADVDVSKSHKVAPLPEGLKTEVNDSSMSAGSGKAPGNVVGSGKGGHEPHVGSGRGKGLQGEGETREGK
jgi:hypothetical protein